MRLLARSLAAVALITAALALPPRGAAAQDLYGFRDQLYAGCASFGECYTVQAWRAIVPSIFLPTHDLAFLSAGQNITTAPLTRPTMFSVVPPPSLPGLGRSPSLLCCSWYLPPGTHLVAGWLSGEGALSLDPFAANRMEWAWVGFLSPFPERLTLWVYTPDPAQTPPPGTTDLRPYSLVEVVVLTVGGPTAVPEPATLALTAGGLLALAAASVRQRRVGLARTD